MRVFEKYTITISIPDELWDSGNDETMDKYTDELSEIMEPILDLINDLELPHGMEIKVK